MGCEVMDLKGNGVDAILRCCLNQGEEGGWSGHRMTGKDSVA